VLYAGKRQDTFKMEQESGAEYGHEADAKRNIEEEHHYDKDER
jgi:hypothetical protein